MKKKIEEMLMAIPISERIALLESLSKKFRRMNSARINSMQMGRKVDSDRPDLAGLKSN